MKHKFKLLISLIAVMMISSCSSYETKDYAQNKPIIDIKQYLSGDLTAHGIIFDWKGKASRHFVAKINGQWNGDDGILREHFTFSDGEIQERTWKIHFNDTNNFTATAGDVIGDGVGSQHGNSVNMEYVLRHKEKDGSTIDLTVDDWMFLTEGGVLLNRSKLYKFGVQVGEVFIAFNK